MYKLRVNDVTMGKRCCIEYRAYALAKLITKMMSCKVHIYGQSRIQKELLRTYVFHLTRTAKVNVFNAFFGKGELT